MLQTSLPCVRASDEILSILLLGQYGENQSEPLGFGLKSCWGPLGKAYFLSLFLQMYMNSWSISVLGRVTGRFKHLIDLYSAKHLVW